MSPDLIEPNEALIPTAHDSPNDMDKETWEDLERRILLLLNQQGFASQSELRELAEDVDALSFQINDKDGPLAVVKQSVTLVAKALEGVEKQQRLFKEGQDKLIKTVEAQTKDRTSAEKMKDRILTILVTLITAGATIAGVILAL